jgi:hypothetical protein
MQTPIIARAVFSWGKAPPAKQLSAKIALLRRIQMSKFVEIAGIRRLGLEQLKRGV